MEEQIRKIMDDELMGNAGDSERCAEKIADTFKRFAEWCIVNGYKCYPDEMYGFCDSDLQFDTLEELFEYWMSFQILE